MPASTPFTEAQKVVKFFKNCDPFVEAKFKLFHEAIDKVANPALLASASSTSASSSSSQTSKLMRLFTASLKNPIGTTPASKIFLAQTVIKNLSSDVRQFEAAYRLFKKCNEVRLGIVSDILASDERALTAGTASSILNAFSKDKEDQVLCLKELDRSWEVLTCIVVDALPRASEAASEAAVVIAEAEAEAAAAELESDVLTEPSNSRMSDPELKGVEAWRSILVRRALIDKNIRRMVD